MRWVRIGLIIMGCVVVLAAWASALGGDATAYGLDVTPSAYAYLPLVAVSRPTPAPDDGLGYVNYYRAIADLPLVTDNPVWAEGCSKHAVYMVKNNHLEHSEGHDNAWYTPEGETCAFNAVLMCSTAVNASAKDAIEAWMQGSFHALPVLDPGLESVGYGIYSEAAGQDHWQTCAALDVSWVRDTAVPTVDFPVQWPSDGEYLPLTTYNVIEWPHPLSSCPGYTRPAGVPMTLQIGPGIGPGNLTPQLTAHSLTLDSVPVEHCIFDETSYVNDDADQQATGRYALDRQDAIMLFPRQPLTPGGITRFRSPQMIKCIPGHFM